MTSVPSVAIYVTKTRVFVISQLMTDHGRVSTHPMFKLSRGAPAAELGAAVLTCLDAFKEQDGPPPPGHFDELKRFLSATSWKPFVRRALNAVVEGPPGKKVTLATARADEHGAFAYGPATECPREPGAIGEALRRLADEAAD